VRLLSSLFSGGNNASTKEKELSMELPETYGLSHYYRKITPYCMLSNSPLPVVLLCNGEKYNNVESPPFSS
jgi:hypothetical protein